MTSPTLFVEFEKRIAAIDANSDYPHERFIKITLEEALVAAKHGNFGVGAVLVDGDGNVIYRAHNHVFHPRFRSDAHAEMNVISEFEEKFQDRYDISNLTLYTSLEPCPMCYARLLISGIRDVYYAAPDQQGGMVHSASDLPSAWHALAKGKIFKRADCSAELSDLAFEIFQLTAREANAKLIGRQ